MESFSTTIKDIAYRGSGVGQHNGKVVFIPHVLQDEQVEAVITRDHRKYAEGRLVNMISASPARCDAACEYFPECQGCCYRHMTYSEELACKEKQLRHFLKRIPEIENAVFESPEPSPATNGYRNKITLHVDSDGETQQIGYIRSDNHSLLPVNHCPLAVPAINEYLANLPELPTGAQRLVLRYSPASGIQSWTDLSPASNEIEENLIFGKIRVPATSFFQVNTSLTDILLTYVKDLIATLYPSSVLDLYCGVGLFALLAATTTQVKVRGIDIDKTAIQTARNNAKRLRLDNIRFEAAPAEKALMGYNRTKADRDLWIVDPPRSGLKKQALDHLLTHQPRSIIYVSCAPDTLARDLERLCRDHYRIKQIKLFDMFPRTYCFETVVLLERR